MLKENTRVRVRTMGKDRPGYKKLEGKTGVVECQHPIAANWVMLVMDERVGWHWRWPVPAELLEPID